MPLKAWVKGVLDEIVQVCLKQPDLEFAWVGDDAVDPLQQARTLSLLVGAGIKTREEARAELGLAPGPAVAPRMRGGSAGVAKYNPYHDERGRFTTPDGAVEPGEGGAPASSDEKPPAGVEVAEIDPWLDNPGVMSDESPTPVAPDQKATNPDSPAGVVGSVELVDPQGASDTASPTSDFTDETSTIWQIARRLVSSAIETLGADTAKATAVASSLAGAILLGSTTSTGDPNYGAVPGRPDVSFEWNPVTGKIQFFLTGQGDQTGRTLIADGQIGKVSGVFLDSQQRILALEVKDCGGYAFANLGLLDEAIAALRSPGEAPNAADDSSGQGDALQVFYNPDTKEMRIAPAGANSDGTLPPGFIAAWSIPKEGNGDGDNGDGQASQSENEGDSQSWKPPAQAVAKVPSDWGPPKPNKGGKPGWRWFDPESPNMAGIRIDPGNPESAFPSQRVDHVIVRSGGVVSGRDGTPINGSIQSDPLDAHIPLDEWLKWQDWNKP